MLVYREVFRRDFELLYQRIGPRRYDIPPVTLISTARDGRAHDAEIRRLPVRANDEVSAERIYLVFQIPLAREDRLEMQLRVRCISVTPLRLLCAV